MENQDDAQHREQAEQQLAQRQRPMQDKRLEKGGEKAYERETDYSDGNVGILDAAVKKHPVQGQQQAYASHFQHIVPGYAVYFARCGHKDPEHKGGQANAIEGQRKLVQRYKFAEKAGGSGNEYGDMQF